MNDKTVTHSKDSLKPADGTDEIAVLFAAFSESSHGSSSGKEQNVRVSPSRKQHTRFVSSSSSEEGNEKHVGEAARGSLASGSKSEGCGEEVVAERKLAEFPAGRLIPAFSEILDGVAAFGDELSFEERIELLIKEVRQFRSQKCAAEKKIAVDESVKRKENELNCDSGAGPVRLLFPAAVNLTKSQLESANNFLKEFSDSLVGESSATGGFSAFCLDPTPAASTSSPGFNYEKMLQAGNNFVLEFMKQDSPDEKQSEKRNRRACYNCSSVEHGVSDCPEPLDAKRIQRNRVYFARQNNMDQSRYHADDDSKYSKFKAGSIGEDLRNALGLRRDDLPPWIYRMRTTGYPPGYFRRLFKKNSELSFCGDGPDGASNGPEASKVQAIEEEQIILYPGFNAPIPSGYYDMADHSSDYLPMQVHHSQEVFLKILREQMTTQNSLVLREEANKKRVIEEMSAKEPNAKKSKSCAAPVDMDVSDDNEETTPPRPPGDDDQEIASPTKNDEDIMILPPPPPIPLEIDNDAAASNGADEVLEVDSAHKESSVAEGNNGDRVTVHRAWSAVSVNTVEGTSLNSGSFSDVSEKPSRQSFAQHIIPFEPKEEEPPAKGMGWKNFKCMLKNIKSSSSTKQ